MKIKNFSKHPLTLPLPSLLQVTKESWEKFWKETFRELLDEVFPIKDYTEKEFELDVVDFKLGDSRYPSEREAKEHNDSYDAPLRFRVRIKNLKTGEIKEQDVFIGYFPLMTSRGTFVINGVERVIISQLIRSPGIFFTLEDPALHYFGAKIIPSRGVWLEFFTERPGQIIVRVDRRRRILATTLLKAFGIKPEEIPQLFEDVDQGTQNFIKTTLERDEIKTFEEAILDLYQCLRPGDTATPDTAQELIKNTFFNFERYDLSEVGRWRTFQRLPQLKDRLPQIAQRAQEGKLEKQDRVLKVEDIIETIREIIRLNNNPEAEPDQIDHLGNRRVRTIHELLKDRLRIGLTRMVRSAKDRMSILDPQDVTPAEVINSRPFNAVVKEFFTSGQISQFMDNENPLSELEHKRRLTASGPGGLSKERAGFEVRDVQPSHYGRICPIQTPEGQNVGIVTYLARYAKVNPYGFLITPYYKVEKGKITKEVHFLTAYEEEQYIIATADTKIKDNKIAQEIVEARVKGKPGIAHREEVDYIDVSPEQFLSVSASLIPFLQNNDANRALMGANMQRQAVPLLIPEKPLVCTGTEIKVAEDSGLLLRAEEKGKILEVDAKHIKVKYNSGKIKDYQLLTFARTNQYTCLHQRPLVRKGDEVKKGQPLASGGGIDGEYLALGKNVLVAFMSWRGNTFEDAIVISERLVRDDVFTSIHIESFTCDVRETKLGPETTTADIPNVAEEKLKDLDEEGIVRIGAWVEPGDILVGKISPKGEREMTPEEKLLRAIFGEKAKEVKDTSLRMEHGKRGRVIGVKVFDRAKGHKLEPGIIKRIEVQVATIRKIQSGDKLANRHGNKGVVAKVLPIEDMPFLEDGTPIDVILNPLGVVSRMNLGQILELHLGLAAKKLGYLAISPSMSGATEEEIKEELKKAGIPEDGKVTLIDGRTGEKLKGKVAVGVMYIMKLIHMVEDKIHMRSIGPYSLITQQPLGGKAQFGGQRFGEMEVWALEGYGAAYTLQEMLTIKSDDVKGRTQALQAILKGLPIRNPNIPASFELLVKELQSLGINVIFKVKDGKIEIKGKDIDKMEELNLEDLIKSKRKT